MTWSNVGGSAPTARLSGRELREGFRARRSDARADMRPETGPQRAARLRAIATRQPGIGDASRRDRPDASPGPEDLLTDEAVARLDAALDAALCDLVLYGLRGRRP